MANIKPENKIVMKKIFWIVCILTALSCQKQNNNLKDKKMIEKFDFEIYKKYNDSGNTPYVLPNGNTIYMMGTPNERLGLKGRGRGFQRERLPKPSFYTLYKEFHSNGNLKRRENYLGDMLVGISKYYDEEGNLIKEVDEDKKFGKIKPQDVLNFLDEKGYINIKTGEGNKEQDKDYRPTFLLYYEEITSNRCIYTIEIVNALPNDHMDFSGGEPVAFMSKYYEMDAETGAVREVSYKEIEKEAKLQENSLSPEEKSSKQTENIIIAIIIGVTVLMASIIIYFKFLKK